MKFKNVLFPIEFSEESKAFYKEIIHSQIFKDSNLYVLHAVDTSSPYLYVSNPGGLPVNFANEMVNYANEKMAELKEEFFYEKPQDKVSMHVRQGIASTEIIDFVEKNDIDLVVMPTHARKGLSHMLLGSVTEKVLRTAPCPVLTVRNKDI